MFSHVMVASNDIDRSKKFYDALFTAVGGNPGEQDARGRLRYAHNGGVLMVSKPIDGKPATHSNGGTIGLSMASPELLVCQAAGRAALAFLGSDAKGKNFYDLWTEASQEKLRRYFVVSARNHRAFRALSASRPTAIKPDRCTLFIPAFGADDADKRFIAITLRTRSRAPGSQRRDIAHLHHIDFLQTQSPGEEKTSQPPV